MGSNHTAVLSLPLTPWEDAHHYLFVSQVPFLLLLDGAHQLPFSSVSALPEQEEPVLLSGVLMSSQSLVTRLF